MNRFELNVAYDGRHYCRVAIPDTNEADAVEKARHIAHAFGSAYNCTLTCWNDTGRKVEF
jgi:hypothetical protein